MLHMVIGPRREEKRKEKKKKVIIIIYKDLSFEFIRLALEYKNTPIRAMPVPATKICPHIGKDDTNLPISFLNLKFIYNFFTSFFKKCFID